MSLDRPLTDAQERALIRLADLSEPDESRDRGRAALGISSEWFPASGRFCRSVATAEVLERLGFVEIRPRDGTLDLEARITTAGRELLAGMGD